MPHAALWVVQQLHKQKEKQGLRSFNAARGFVGGATETATKAVTFMNVSMPHAALWVVQHDMQIVMSDGRVGFNAARGFVGGATASLAALVPLRGKRPFGKSPEI